MLNLMPPAPPVIRVEIEVNGELLAALQKLASCAPLSNTERFEIAALTFMTARALCAKKRPRSRRA